jgi:hypothetical protein
MMRAVPSQVVAFVDDVFPWSKDETAGVPTKVSLNYGHGGPLVALLKLLDNIPDELITVGAEEQLAFLAAIGCITNAVAAWQHAAARDLMLGPIPGSKDPSHPVGIIRRALVRCPDAVIPPRTAELAFLGADKALRDDLRRDIWHMERALINEEWKAATVLAGSVVEALLLWALSRPKYRSSARATPSVPSKPLDEWHLPDYVRAALHTKLLTPDVASECELTKNYRNLIHPGRARRLQQQCDRGTTRVALAAVEHVVVEFERRFPRRGGKP